MQHSFFYAKTTLILLFISLSLVLSGCSQNSNPKNEINISDGNLSAPLPSALVVVDASTLVVELKEGDKIHACNNLSVDQSNGTFSCDLSLPAGAHTLELVYSINDATHGKVQVATSTGIQVDVKAGETTTSDFSATTLSYNDDDNDGINNLQELDAGTNPAGSECIIGSSLIGFCTLG